MSAAEDEAPVGRPITIEAFPMRGFGGGLRQNWIEGEAEGVRISLDSGAGLGNPYLTLSVEVDGHEARWETIDVQPLLRQWAKQVEQEIRDGVPGYDPDRPACSAPSGWHDDGDPMGCTRAEGHGGDHDHAGLFQWAPGTLATDGDGAWPS